MNILLTGSEGFVGTSLQKSLRENGHEVLCLDRVDRKGKKNYVKVDLSEKISDEIINEVSEYQINLVIHCAAAKGDFQLSEKDFYRDNVTATTNLLLLIDALQINDFIHYSTVSVYGHDNELKNETSPINPNNPYGITKADSEIAIINWYKENTEKRRLTVLRPSVIYGENNYANMYNLMAQLNKKAPVMIGSGDYVKSMVALENLIDITNFSIVRLVGLQIYNCTDEPYPKLSEVVAMIAEIDGFNLPKIKIPYIFALAMALPFELFSFITGKDVGITRERLYKFKTATDFRSDLLREKGYVQAYTTKERIQNMAKWYLTQKN